jgi:hypothetical protein
VGKGTVFVPAAHGPRPTYVPRPWRGRTVRSSVVPTWRKASHLALGSLCENLIQGVIPIPQFQERNLGLSVPRATRAGTLASHDFVKTFHHRDHLFR